MKKILLYILSTILIMILWIVALIFGTVAGWWHKPIAEESTPESFSTAVDREIDRQFVGSFAMATMAGGKIQSEKFHSAGNPVDRNTAFQVSSLSKWISAFGIMKLVEDGKLDLDAPVSTYLTRWQLPPGEYDNDGVTVRRLLSHTAGLTDGLGYSGFEAGTPLATLEQSLTKAPDADPGVGGEVRVGLPPGSAFKYSGGGYTLLQLIVEEVSGQTFEAYMKQSVFVPLGMSSSTYVWSEVDTTLVEFYNSDGSNAKHYRYTSLAATSLYTSLSDMELFFQAHLPGNDHELPGRDVLTPQTLQMMRQPNAQQLGADIWGLGTVLYVPIDNNDFIVGHDGKSTPPINTAVRLNPETGDGIIVLSTGNRWIATRLASEWVFWKTGKVDLFLFQMLMTERLATMGIGCVAILLIAIGLVSWRRFR